MFDVNKFKYFVNVKGVTLENVANAIGINPATLSRKIAGESDFKRHEIQAVKNYLGLSLEDVDDIFFAP